MFAESAGVVKASPVNSRVPPHDPLNHSVTAPAPFDPPVTVNVVLPPMQTDVVPVAPVGATDGWFTVTSCVTPLVFGGQGAASFSIRTQ